jgi:predicted nuclease of predicted toxin-antitoxin system
MRIKLLFDQNLSYRIVPKLDKLFPNSEHIAALGLDKASDIEVFKYAKENNFVIVTKDSDFNELCTLYDFPPYIIWLRVGNSNVKTAIELLSKYEKQIIGIISENKTGIIEIK